MWSHRTQSSLQIEDYSHADARLLIILPRSVTEGLEPAAAEESLVITTVLSGKHPGQPGVGPRLPQ